MHNNERVNNAMKFGLNEKVSTFDPNMEPLVPVDSVGIISKVYEDHPSGVGYDVTIHTTEETVEDFFFHEFELSEAN